MKNKLTQNKVSFSTIVIYLAAILLLTVEVFLSFSLLPQRFDQVKSKWDKLSESKTLQVKLNSTLSSIDAINLVDLEGSVKKVKAALPDEKKSYGIVTSISNLASNYAVLVKSLELNPGIVSTRSAVKKVENLEEIPASLSLAGQLDSVANFLDALNKSSQLIGVSSVNYSSASTNNEDVRLILRIYFQPSKTSDVDITLIPTISNTDFKLLEELQLEDIFKLQ